MAHSVDARSNLFLEGAFFNYFPGSGISPSNLNFIQEARSSEGVLIEAGKLSFTGHPTDMTALSALIKIHSYSQNLLVITIHLQSTQPGASESNVDFVAYKISRTISQTQETFKTSAYHIKATSNKIERSVKGIFKDLIYLLCQHDSHRKNLNPQTAEFFKTPDNPDLIQFLGEPSILPNSETNPSPTSSSFSKAALIAAMILFSAAACFVWKKGYFSPKDAQQLNRA